MNDQQNRYISRRQMLIRTASTMGAVAAAGTLGGVTFAPAAQAATNPTAQKNWAWCKYCLGLWNTVYGTPRCWGSPNGLHTGAGSANYVVFYSSNPEPGQPGWRWCRNCALLHFGTGGGYCPDRATAHVSTGSSNYAVLIVGGPSGDIQDNWRYCHNCRGLWWNGNRSAGACPSPLGHHVIGDSNYALFPY